MRLFFIAIKIFLGLCFAGFGFSTFCLLLNNNPMQQIDLATLMRFDFIFAEFFLLAGLGIFLIGFIDVVNYIQIRCNGNVTYGIVTDCIPVKYRHEINYFKVHISLLQEDGRILEYEESTASSFVPGTLLRIQHHRKGIHIQNEMKVEEVPYDIAYKLNIIHPLRGLR